jgi:hypothetical protein
MALSIKTGRKFSTYLLRDFFAGLQLENKRQRCTSKDVIGASRLRLLILPSFLHLIAQQIPNQFLKYSECPEISLLCRPFNNDFPGRILGTDMQIMTV